MIATIQAQLDRIEAKLDAMLTPTADIRQPTTKFLTISEAVREYNCSAKKLYRMKSVQARIGRAVRINRDAMDRLINQRDRLA